MLNIPLGLSVVSLISLYFIFQRLRFTTQSRAAKSISDEIVKINDFCIEFLETYTYISQNPDEKIDKKDIVALNTLAKKIDLHFEYLANQIKHFPYGTVISQFTNRKTYHKTAHMLFINYQDKMRSDTILERGVILFENNQLRANNFIPFDIKKLDLIIDAGNQLNNYLEKHLSSLLIAPLANTKQ